MAGLDVISKKFEKNVFFFNLQNVFCTKTQFRNFLIARFDFLCA